MTTHKVKITSTLVTMIGFYTQTGDNSATQEWIETHAEQILDRTFSQSRFQDGEGSQVEVVSNEVSDSIVQSVHAPVSGDLVVEWRMLVATHQTFKGYDVWRESQALPSPEEEKDQKPVYDITLQGITFRVFETDTKDVLTVWTDVEDYHDDEDVVASINVLANLMLEQCQNRTKLDVAALSNAVQYALDK